VGIILIERERERGRGRGSTCRAATGRARAALKLKLSFSRDYIGTRSVSFLAEWILAKCKRCNIGLRRGMYARMRDGGKSDKVS